MSNTVDSTHIQVTVTCQTCGHQFDVENYDAQSVAEAEAQAAEEPCPECSEDE